MSLRRYAEHLFEQRPRGLVNPYRVHDPRLDVEDGWRLRRANLLAHWDVIDPAVVLVGEALGYRGGRFTGIPFSSERLILDGTVPSAGYATCRQGPLGEATATIVRRALDDLGVDALGWNALPFHPHRPGEPMSNRSPAPAELRRHAPLLQGFIDAAPDVPVVAVGNAAARSLMRLGVAHQAVVHPARGRAKAFQDGLRRVLRAP